MSSLAIFFCVLLAIPAQMQAQDVVASACAKALYKDVCQSSLASAPNKADKTSVCTYALNLVSSAANEVTKQVGASTEAAAKDCSTAYSSAMDSIKEAQTAAASGQFTDVNSKISAAMSAATTCENGFKETKTTSPVTALNTKFTQLCSTVLAVTNA